MHHCAYGGGGQNVVVGVQSARAEDDRADLAEWVEERPHPIGGDSDRLDEHRVGETADDPGDGTGAPIRRSPGSLPNGLRLGHAGCPGLA